MDNIKLVNNIKNLCSKNNISISQMEKEVNLSSGLISRWTKTTPSLDRLIDIAHFFNVTIDALIGENAESEVDKEIIYLIYVLYQETQKLKMQWNIFDMDNPPFHISKPAHDILDKEKHDYYYAAFENGYFLIGMPCSEPINSLTLYALPDSNSLPQAVCSDYGQLVQLFELVSNNLRKKLNKMKTDKFIHSFLESARSSNELDKDSNDCTSEDDFNKIILYDKKFS